MIWKKPVVATVGDFRWVTKFAWFPIDLNNGRMLWLEKYNREEICFEVYEQGIFRIPVARWQPTGKVSLPHKEKK